MSVAASELAQRGLGADMMENVCIDMSAAFAAGVRTAFPKAKITFDHFHVIQLINTAMDQVRRRERTAFPEELQHSRWLLVRPANPFPRNRSPRSHWSGVATARRARLTTCSTPFDRFCVTLIAPKPRPPSGVGPRDPSEVGSQK